MPKITESEREARRNQILDAARACVAEHGLEAVSMEMIIKASGVSVGAVYRYFKGKDEVIAAAFIAGTEGLVATLEPIWARTPVPSPADLLGQLLGAVQDFRYGTPVDLGTVAVHGWSHAQNDPDLKAGAALLYGSIRHNLARAARAWRDAGRLDASADPESVAQLMFSIVVGFSAQRALIGDADVDAHVAALRGLIGAGAAPLA